MSPTEQNFGTGYSPGQLQYQAAPFNYPSPPEQYASYVPNLPTRPQHVVTSASSGPHFPGTVGVVNSASSPSAFPVISEQNAPRFPTNKNGTLPQNVSPTQSRLPGSSPREGLPSTGSPGASPEVYELIRRQDHQLSELKMQIQLLLDAQRRRSIGEGDVPRGNRESPTLSERASLEHQKEQRSSNASDASTMTETPSSPPKQQPLLFDVGTQTDNVMEGSRCTLCGRHSPPRTLNHASPQMSNRPYEAPERDDEAYTLFFPEKAQKDNEGRRTADAFYAEQQGHSTAVKRGGHVPARPSDPCSGISIDHSKGHTYNSPYHRFESPQHTVSFCDDISMLGKAGPQGDTTAKSTLETFIHPRLKYQTLNLNESSMYRASGSDLSFQANCITQKYCPSAKNFGASHPSPAAFGERKKKGPHGHGLLKQVLEQEAQRKGGHEMFSTYEESNAVSFATREYLRNYGLLDDRPRHGRDDDDDVEDRVLNISELKKLPKLL